MLAVTVVASDSVIAPNTRSSTVMCSPSNSSLTSNSSPPLIVASPLIMAALSQVELLVEVLDLNDESPMFTQPFGYAIPVSEGSTVPSVITTGVCGVGVCVVCGVCVRGGVQ